MFGTAKTRAEAHAFYLETLDACLDGSDTEKRDWVNITAVSSNIL